MARVLVVTNDFPPRRGGIESFVFSLCEGLPPDEVVVYTASMAGSAAFDSRLSYPVIRDRSRTLLPTKRVAREVRATAAEHGCDRVVFGAAAPLGLLARGLRAAAGRSEITPATRFIGLTHGHEVWWSKTPGFREMLRRIGDSTDVLTYVSEFCRREIGQALRPAAAGRMQRLAPGVDSARFRPGLDGSVLRRQLGIAADAPVVLTASRLVPRKGQDVLIKAMPRILARRPDAVLMIVGRGPTAKPLRLLARRRGVEHSVVFMPGVAWHDMPTAYAAADVFALPTRTRLRGLEVEALGIVFLEAAAAGLPVIVGDSGGAPETVVEAETGYVVDSHDVPEVAERVLSLLDDPGKAAEMGRRGRERVEEMWTAEESSAAFRALLDLE